MIVLNEILKNQFSLDQMLHIFPVLLSVFFIIQMLSQKSINKISRNLLVLLLMQFFIIFLTSTIIQFHFKFLQKILLPFFVPAFLVIPAACYVYLKSLTEENFVFTKRDFFHFLPAIVLWFVYELLIFPFFFSFGKPASDVGKIVVKVLFVLSYGVLVFGGIVQFVIYLFLGIRQYLRHQKKIKNYFSDLENIRLRWMKWFLFGYVLFLAVMMLSNLDSVDKTIRDLSYLIVSILFVSFVGYYGVKQVDIYARFHALAQSLQKGESNIITEEVKEFSENEVESEIIDNSEQTEHKISDTFYSNNERQIELKNEIIKLLVEEKKYLNVSLTLDDIAKELHINKKYVSFVINSMMNSNFYNLVNEQRVLEAQKLLAGSGGSQYTIEGVGNMAGFKSRSSFITAFKKYTGKTPSEFKQTNLN